MLADWEDIVAGCLRREREAQRVVYERYFAYGMGVAIRYCDDRDQAVTVLHDAFLKTFRRLDRYDPARAFEPWFRTIVVRAALDARAARRKAARTVMLPDHDITRAREDTLSRLGYAELLAMVQRLSDAYRTVFNLHVIDGFKHEEIARELGISVGTSKSNLHKARAQLRRMVVSSLRTARPRTLAPEAIAPAP